MGPDTVPTIQTVVLSPLNHACACDPIIVLRSVPFAPDLMSAGFRRVSGPWNATQIVTLILGLFWVKTEFKSRVEIAWNIL